MVDANAEGEKYVKLFINEIENELNKNKHVINKVAYQFKVEKFDFILNFEINNKKPFMLTIDYDELENFAKKCEMPGKNLLNEKVQELIAQL